MTTVFSPPHFYAPVANLYAPSFSLKKGPNVIFFFCLFSFKNSHYNFFVDRNASDWQFRCCICIYDLNFKNILYWSWIKLDTLVTFMGKMNVTYNSFQFNYCTQLIYMCLCHILVNKRMTKMFPLDGRKTLSIDSIHVPSCE